MGTQLIFDNPRNRYLLNRYKDFEINNPQWEPGGQVRRGGKTVNVNGVEYYQIQNYADFPYKHLNEKDVRLKYGGKKSQLVSDVLDVAIPKLTKYGLAAASIAGPTLAGQPALIPAAMMLSGDASPFIASQLRKGIKKLSGYGVYQGRTLRSGILDLDEDEENEDAIPMKDLVKKKPVKKINRKKLVNKNITVEEMAVPVVKKAPAKKAPAKKAPAKKAVVVVAKIAEPTVAVKKAPAVKPPMAPAKKALPEPLKKWQADVKKYSEKNNIPYGKAMVALSEKRKNCGSAESCYVKAKKIKKCKC